MSEVETTARNGRLVTLVVHPSRERLGPLAVEMPWWPETESVVDAAFAVTGRRFVVLRLLDATTEHNGGEPTYLVEERSQCGVPEPVDHPKRMPWARPGVALDDVAWACGELDGPLEAAQIKSWNLSSLWRLERGSERFWLKVVPPFFAHEGALTQWLSDRGHPVPPVVALDGNRALCRHVEGEDGFGAGEAWELALMNRLLGIQVDCRSAGDELVALGVPDWRADSLALMAAETVDARRDELTVDEQHRLEDLIASISVRLDVAPDAGINDTLVHGDPHPGNARFVDNPFSLTILDWGDASVGCPLFDLRRMPGIADRWLDRWAVVVPGSEPRRAWHAVEPVAALKDAVVYQRFLDRIEPSEQIYHRFDVLPPLAEAAALVG